MVRIYEVMKPPNRVGTWQGIRIDGFKTRFKDSKPKGLPKKLNKSAAVMVKIPEI